MRKSGFHDKKRDGYGRLRPDHPCTSNVKPPRNGRGTPLASGMRPSIPSEYRAARRPSRAGISRAQNGMRRVGQPHFGGRRGRSWRARSELVVRSRSTIEPSAAREGNQSVGPMRPPRRESWHCGRVIVSAFPSNRKVQALSPAVSLRVAVVWMRTPFACGKRYDTLPRDESSDRAGGGCSDQTRTVVSLPAVTANRPSGEQATDQTVFACAVSGPEELIATGVPRPKPSIVARPPAACPSNARNVGHARDTDQPRSNFVQ